MSWEDACINGAAYAGIFNEIAEPERELDDLKARELDGTKKRMKEYSSTLVQSLFPQYEFPRLGSRFYSELNKSEGTCVA